MACECEFCKGKRPSGVVDHLFAVLTVLLTLALVGGVGLAAFRGATWLVQG